MSKLNIFSVTILLSLSLSLTLSLTLSLSHTLSLSLSAHVLFLHARTDLFRLKKLLKCISRKCTFLEGAFLCLLLGNFPRKSCLMAIFPLPSP